MRFELEPFNRSVSDEDLLSDLVTAAETLKAAGKSLTFRNYREVGKYGPSTINDRFGSWNNALRKAGLALAEEKNVPVDVLFDNLRLVWIAKGKQPVYRDMNGPPSQYTGSTYNARFGGWRKALEEFVATVTEEQELLTTPEARQPPKQTGRRTNRDPSLSLRFLVLKRDCFRCTACGRSPATHAGLILEIDHVIAWSKGGETIAENLQSLCFDCNRGKSAT
ncbi:homing endonuclease associated repeat-containing protein [Anatilimnocola floriformis]|uniref:homing endonuclease associated repeat-containing protein n=1 Tax=Anatilimnocola floriformis TaxID=2948575 RepID=UPI0020C234B9|nr:HNH endonuclease [Anatilimnocola floriformis]